MANKSFLGCLAGWVLCSVSIAQPSVHGQSGYVHAPSALVENDGTWTIGMSYDKPYVSTYSTFSILPFLEGTLKFNQIRGVLAFPDQPNNRESYKDEEFDLKLRLTEEVGVLPAIAVGIQDYFGTKLFATEYIVATKKIGQGEFSLGYAPNQLTFKTGENTGVQRHLNRMHGVFWGARYRLGDTGFSLVAEKNPIDYRRDPFIDQTKVDQYRRNDHVLGMEYQWKWVGTQVSIQDGIWSANAYLRIPLWEKEFIPKLQEPEPYREIVPRPTPLQWGGDTRYRDSILAALKKQGFSQVNLQVSEAGVMHISLGHYRISKMSRAVGRAVRTALLLSPTHTREIRLVFIEAGLPFMTYEFTSLEALSAYLAGMMTRYEFRKTVNVHFARPDEAVESHAGKEENEIIAGIDEETGSPLHIIDNETGNLIAVRTNDTKNSFSFVPFKISTMSKSAAGYYQYQVYSSLKYTRQIGDDWSVGSALMLRLTDNFQPFPGGTGGAHGSAMNVVRSDYYDYVEHTRYRLQRLYLNKNYHLSERVYGRLTGGLLEEMYSGLQGQLLYFPETAPWAADVELSAVQKRAPDSEFGMRDYKTLMGLASFHYRLPKGIGFTVRAGRFLAEDWGARFEITRRFESGLEAGAWLGVTDNKDLHAPGSEGKPYKDKGVWVTIPFGSFAFKDNKTTGIFAWQEWGRDVAQTVDSPIDLYSSMRDGWLNKRNIDGLSQFAEVDDDYTLPALGSPSLLDRNMWELASTDLANARDVLGSGQTWLKMSAGIGIVGLSAVGDKSVDRFVSRFADRTYIKKMINVGNIMPLAALGIAGLTSLDGSNPRLARTGMAALQAGGVGLLSSIAVKSMVGRSRPEADQGPFHFATSGSERTDSAFFSGHTVAIWGAVTPFAKEYDMPWLYGVAGLTNFARIADRKHWLSDTVTGSLLGYWLGDTFLNWRRKEMDQMPVVTVGPQSVGMQMNFH